MINRLVALFLCFTLVFAVAPPPSKAEARSVLGDILIGAAAIELVTSYYKSYSRNSRDEIRKETMRETGVSDNKEAQNFVHTISARLLTPIEKQGQLEYPYSVWVNPRKDFNAFCTLGHNVSINQGLLDELNWNEDEVAFVMAHEFVHGQENHSLKHLKKALGMALIADIYYAKNPNDVSALLSVGFTRILHAKNTVLPDEWAADNNAFHYAVQAGYNPGAGAAVWARYKAKHGERTQNFWGEIVNPNDHPTPSQRIANYSDKLVQYSNGLVRTDGITVFVNGEPFFTPKAAYGQQQSERAYLIAGKLARFFHAVPKHELPTKMVIAEDGVVKIDSYSIVTPAEDETAAEVAAERLNALFSAL